MIKNILHLDSSAKSEGSITRLLTHRAVEKLTTLYPNAQVKYHDLTAESLPHINPHFLKALLAGTQEGVPADLLKLSDRLIDELFACDIMVIGAPMYNFNIPSQLKAWIDYICRSGKTFKYTAEGPVGLLSGKKAIVAVSSGGLYSSGPMQNYDHVVPYMKQVLGFIGITDVAIARAEKQALGAEIAAAELHAAENDIDLDVQKFTS